MKRTKKILIGIPIALLLIYLILIIVAYLPYETTARAPSPNGAQIDKAMAGNICRCGTYGRIRAAILAAARRS